MESLLVELDARDGRVDHPDFARLQISRVSETMGRKTRSQLLRGTLFTTIRYGSLSWVTPYDVHATLVHL